MLKKTPTTKPNTTVSASVLNRYSSISLFSGIGGIDEGLHIAGFTPLACVELDKNARATLEGWASLRNVCPRIENDVNAINPEKFRKELNLKKGELDLLAGGPPCQSFSLIGKRLSLDDDRGQLLYKMISFAAAFKPKAVLIEQVKGLLSAKGSDGKPGSALKFLISELEDLGYGVSYSVLKASHYGVPQDRERVFVVALKGKKKFQFPTPTHAKDSGQLDLISDIKPILTLRDAIGDLPKPAVKGSLPKISSHIDITPARDRQRICAVPEGDYLARQLHLEKSLRGNLDAKKDTTKFRRLSWNLPALTLRGGEAFYHPSEDRYLTPREYLRIHGFSDDFQLVGPIRGRSGSVRDLDQHRLVANAVPPPLAFAIAEQIIRQLK